MDLSIHILCPVRVERTGQVIGLSAQTRAVLALLALRSGTPVPAERLLDELYPGGAPRTARVNLQGLVSTLRRVLGTVSGHGATVRPIATEAGGYVLRVPPAQLDLLRFERAYGAADARRRTGGPAAEVARAWAAVLDEWSGTPCEDIDLPAVHRLVAPLVRRYADAVEYWAEAALEADPATADVAAAAVAARLYPEVTAFPFHDRMRALLMTALCRAGRRTEALNVYEQGRRHLAEELGLDPSPPLRRLHHALLVGAVPAGAGPDRRTRPGPDRTTPPGPDRTARPGPDRTAPPGPDRAARTVDVRR